MAHEINEHDHVVLHREAAWHGLGTVVENAPTPLEALKLARLDWTVEQWPLAARARTEQLHAVDSHVLNVRSDTHTHLGIVGSGYKPIQNEELAEFCQALAEGEDTVKVESAGSIRNGQKVWFLLKGESFSIRGTGAKRGASGNDEMKPYICVSNGHDGWTALRCTPTTVRVVCSNTLHMVIPSSDQADIRKFRATQAHFVARHTGTIKGRLEDAKKALQLYGKSLESTKSVIDRIAAQKVDREIVQRFFLECYTRDFGDIPMEPSNKKEDEAKFNAMEACHKTFKRFDEEQRLYGANLWTAMNAYTGWLQNDRKIGTRDLEKAPEKRVELKLFGLDGDRAVKAFTTAATLVVAS